MGRKWIYRLKKEDFAHVAQSLNIALDDRLDDMRRTLSEYYSETENDPLLVDIWAGPSITLTNAEGDNLVAKGGPQESVKRDPASKTMQRSLNKSASGRTGSTWRKNHSSSWI